MVGIYGNQIDLYAVLPGRVQHPKLIQKPALFKERGPDGYDVFLFSDIPHFLQYGVSPPYSG